MKNTVAGSESSLQIQPENNLCQDCIRSVDLNDAKTTVRTLNPEDYRMAFKEESHHERRDTIPGLDRLLASTETGCGLCQFLRQEILNKLESHDSWKSHTEELVLRFSYIWRLRNVGFIHKPSLDGLSVDITHPALDTVQLLSFHVSACSDLIKNWLPIVRETIDHDRLSPKNVNRIRCWVPSEDSGHQQGQTPFIPTRLIDLEPESPDPTPESVANELGIDPCIAPATLHRHPVLVENDTSPTLSSAKDTIRYVALSYCWGSSGPPLKTETNTLEDRLRGMPICDMPQCFQDAIKVIQVLGLRYVWIDSLCIIQDDQKDWANEASLMFDIFSNSYLTLGSYFIQKSPPKYLPGDSYWDDPIPWKGDMLSSEWNNRGWVWQEQNAPSKLLVWGESMFHFRDSIVNSEDGSEATTLHFDLGYLGYDPDGDGHLYVWYGLMKEFSSKKFSYRTDRLPAVSGLAKLISRTTKDEYRAGHWYNKENFWKELCWTVWYPPTFDELLLDLTASERYSAPSWSWASRSQQAMWELIPHRVAIPYESEIIDCQFLLDGEDSTGAVREGKLIIRGKLKQVQVPPSTGQDLAGRYPDSPGWSWALKVPGTGWISYTLDWRARPKEGYGSDWS
ncbi:heterokaryon incompatibility protein [Rutstroemia sp. NJR-2017a WRK4]|nr:heterokaryon incompatibility protein [Rutstroemia sp. NJR-2017a WRK4]